MSEIAEGRPFPPYETMWQGSTAPVPVEEESRTLFALADVNDNRVGPPYALSLSEEFVDSNANIAYKPVPPQMVIPSVTENMVPVDTVMKVASSFVGAFSGLALLAYLISGLVIVQPFISILFILGSIGFYVMSILRK